MARGAPERERGGGRQDINHGHGIYWLDEVVVCYVCVCYVYVCVCVACSKYENGSMSWIEFVGMGLFLRGFYDLNLDMDMDMMPSMAMVTNGRMTGAV